MGPGQQTAHAAASRARGAAGPADRRLVPRAPAPTTEELRGSLGALLRVAPRRARPGDLDARDPSFIDDLQPLMGLLYDTVFRCETELDAPIPEGPVLIVANHNAMTGTPDMFCHMTAFWRLYGSKRLGYGLMHDQPFSLPAAGAWFNAAGALGAGHDNARRALDRGAALLVFPGGDLDACKPFRDRYRVDFGARRGFVRLALRERVPIVPLVSAGAHESLLILARGARLARWLRLDRTFRSNVFPVGLALPWGLVAGIPYPHLPLPVKIHTRILAPVTLDLPPSAADDPRALDAAYAAVVGPMQAAMDGMAREGRHGLVPAAARAATREALERIAALARGLGHERQELGGSQLGGAR